MGKHQKQNEWIGLHDMGVWILSCFLVAACGGKEDEGSPVSTTEAGVYDGDHADGAITDGPIVDTPTPDPASGCPVEEPTPMTDAGVCDLPADQECVYPIPCTNGTPNKAIYRCDDGVWKSIRDLGCGQGPQPIACTDACTTPNTRCRDVAEVCPGNENLYRRCTCANGSWGGCSRDYDCNPPSTCVSPAGDCLTVGMQNWSTRSGWCPEGTTMQGCEGPPCTPDAPRPRCNQIGGESHSAACVYGRWACPVGFTGPVAP